MADLSPDEARAVRRAVLRLNAQAWGVSFGLLLGIGLMLATLILTWKGGPAAADELGLLRVYLPGYRVTTGGAFLGFVYAFVIGYGMGRLVGTAYNWFAGTTR
jgi:hypothetical protein